MPPNITGKAEMSKNHLAPEVIALIHHVELNQSGWWKKAVSQVIRGVLWAEKNPVTTAELKLALAKSGVEVQLEFIEKQLLQLRDDSQAVELASKKWKLTEKTKGELDVFHSAASQEAAQCQELFEIECKANCPDLNSSEVWTHFITELAAAIHLIGANTYHLLTDGALERDLDWLGRFTGRFEPLQLDGLKKVMGHFFASSNVAARNYLLRILTGYFFAEATRLTPQTLQLIDKGRAKRAIKIILDTNFIFSILGLHDNPANEAAIDLVKLSETSGANLEIRLYVLPGTIDESIRTLAAQAQNIDRIRSSRAISGAALNAPLSGIAARFFRAAGKAPGLSAQGFFDPYLTGLKQILAEKGVQVLEAHPTVYNVRQAVIDDVLEQRDREQQLPENRQKSYEAWLHDVVLWHVINDHRSSSSNSPFDVEYWAVTIDWRLINFDRMKRDQFNLPVPTVLHPSNLIQLLQFWLPRSEALEATLIDSLRLPLFFRNFDPEDEKATLRILQALSRYENLDDLPANAIPPLLANQALRARLRDGDIADDEMLTLVREELLSEHKQVLETLAGKEEHLRETETKLAQANQSVEQQATKLEAFQTDKQALENERQRLLIENERLTLESSKNNFLLRYVVTPSLLAVTLILAVYSYLLPLVANQQPWQNFLAFALAVLTPFFLAIWRSHYYIHAHPKLLNWSIAFIYQWLYKKIFLLVIPTMIGGIWQGGVWDGVKKLLSIT